MVFFSIIKKCHADMNGCNDSVYSFGVDPTFVALDFEWMCTTGCCHRRKAVRGGGWSGRVTNHEIN